MRVWSVSPYFGERDIALIKWGEQREVVDTFVFMEASRNHQGQPREQVGLGEPLHSLPEVRYGFYDLPKSEPWEMEMGQRAKLIAGMPDLEPEDLVIVSDLDEILSAGWIRRFAAGDWTLPAQIAFTIHPYRLDWRWAMPVEEGWCRCTVARGHQVLEHGTNGVLIGPKYNVLLEREAGWHFTYQGTPEQLVHKAHSIADGWTAGVTVEDARRSIAEGVDLFGRDRPVEPVPLEELPRYVQRNRARFSHLLREGDEDGRQDGNEEGGTQAEGRQVPEDEGSTEADLP